MPQITVTPKYINPAKPGKKYASINVDGVYYSFDPAKIPLSAFQKNVPVEIEYTVTDSNGNTYYNIQRIVAPQSNTGYAGGGASQSARPQQQATITASGGGMSKEDWERKDRIITRSAIAKSCIEANITDVSVANFWVNWIYQTGDSHEGPPRNDPHFNDDHQY